MCWNIYEPYRYRRRRRWRRNLPVGNRTYLWFYYNDGRYQLCYHSEPNCKHYVLGSQSRYRRMCGTRNLLCNGKHNGKCSAKRYGVELPDSLYNFLYVGFAHYDRYFRRNLQLYRNLRRSYIIVEYFYRRYYALYEQ